MDIYKYMKCLGHNFTFLMRSTSQYERNSIKMARTKKRGINSETQYNLHK